MCSLMCACLCCPPAVLCCAALDSVALQVVQVCEYLVSALPPSPQLLQLLLAQANRFCTGSSSTTWLSWLSWLLPLAAGTCCRCQPVAPVSCWAAVIQLTGGVSASAAADLAQQAVMTHPWSLQLWQLHHDTAGEAPPMSGGPLTPARCHWSNHHERLTLLSPAALTVCVCGGGLY
jgi:hypothetical protein